MFGKLGEATDFSSPPDSDTVQPSGPKGSIPPPPVEVPVQRPPSEPPRPAPTGAQTVYTDDWPLALAIVTIGAFMSVLDVSIVNVAIPTMRDQFGVSTTEIEWVATAYSLSLGVIVPVSGWLGERFGLARVYAWSLVGFGVTSAMCGLAWDLTSEVAFRIMQAIPGGVLPVITLTMLYRVVPREKMGIGMAAYGMSMVFAPAIGPTLGGYLVEYHSWQWIFFLNVPVGAIGAALAFTMLPRFPRNAVGTFDTWGFVTIAGGLFSLLLALSKGADWGWSGYRILILFTASALLMALFVVIELEVEQPLLDVRLFLIWSFSNSLVLIGILSSAFFTLIFYLPLFMQEGQGITPLNAGLAMFPEAIAMAITLPLAGLLYTKMGPRWPIVFGMIITGYGTYLLSGMTADLSRTDVMIWTSLRGAGQALCMVPLLTVGLDKVPSDKLDSASALNNVMQRVTGALGLAVMSAMATNAGAQNSADLSALMTNAGTQTDPRATQMLQQGPREMLAYMKLWELKVHAQAYSNVFLFLAVCTFIGVLFALTFSSKKPDADGPKHLDLGM